MGARLIETPEAIREVMSPGQDATHDFKAARVAEHQISVLTARSPISLLKDEA